MLLQIAPKGPLNPLEEIAYSGSFLNDVELAVLVIWFTSIWD